MDKPHTRELSHAEHSIRRYVIAITVIVVPAATTAHAAEPFDKRRNPAWDGFRPPPVRSVEAENGRVLVNGRPFLPRVLYHAAHWHMGLREAGEKGFNVVQTYGISPETYRIDIDNAYENGMYSAAALNDLCDGSEASLQRVKKIVVACRNAPGLLVWMLQDEVNARRLAEPRNKPYRERPYEIPPERLKLTYDLIKRLDPVHPIWLNLCYGWLDDHKAYNSVADVKSDDIYPVPENPLPCVASYADVTVRGAAGKPAWLVLQMCPVRPQFGDKDRHPTMTEVRCMTYMALAHGITGLGYYSFSERPGSTWRTSESAPAFWAQWSDLNGELNTLSPYLLSPAIKAAIEVVILQGPTGAGPWGFPALHLSLRKTENGFFLIAVNGLNEPVKARLTMPPEAAGSLAAVRYENRTLSLQGRILEDSFAAYAVHLYELPLSR